MIILARAILAGIAGYRLASMLVEEDGPGDVFRRLREAAGLNMVLTAGGWEKLQAEPTSWTGKLLRCFWCTSVWTSSACYAVGALVSWTPIAVIASWGVATLARSQEKD